MSMGCSSRPSPLAVALLTCFAVTQLSAPAWAFRPFDGTDAEVAEPGEVEIELQPAGILQEGSEKTLVAPGKRCFQGRGNSRFRHPVNPVHRRMPAKRRLKGRGIRFRHLVNPLP